MGKYRKFKFGALSNKLSKFRLNPPPPGPVGRRLRFDQKRLMWLEGDASGPKWEVKVDLRELPESFKNQAVLAYLDSEWTKCREVCEGCGCIIEEIPIGRAA